MIQLTEIRIRRGLTQVQLAKRSGISANHISHFEAGKRDPHFRNLIKLANGLQVTIDELMGRTVTSTLNADFVSRMSELTSDDLDLVERFVRMLRDRKVN